RIVSATGRAEREGAPGAPQAGPRPRLAPHWGQRSGDSRKVGSPMTPPVKSAGTSSQPAGIGPDLCVRLAERRWPTRIVLFGDIELLRDRARRLGAGVRLVPYAKGDAAPPGAIEVAHYPLATGVTAGRPDPANARTVLAM